MGMFQKLTHALKLKKEKMTILVVGLNNSGKTTIINHFKKAHNQTAITIPTVGFSMEQFQSDGVSFSVIDMSGALRYRNLWEHHFKTCAGIVFCIDSSDKMRLIVVKDELNILMQHPYLQKKPIPILFYGNKIDCADSMSKGKIAAALELEYIKSVPWYICSSNANSGEGLDDGIQWLIQNIRFSGTHKEGAKQNVM